MKLVLGAVAAVAVLGGAGFVVMGQNSGPDSTDITALTAPDAQSAVTVTPISSHSDDGTVQEMVLGAEDAPVTIIEYASYTCPHCATFHTGVFKELKRDYIDTGKVKFIYREVYFDRYGLWASMVARCGGPERFFGISDLIYGAQAEWTQAGDPGSIANALRQIGRLAGLSDDQLEACLTDGDKAQALVTWYEANQAQDNIRSTPSFLIDGELYSNMRYSEFSDIIDGKIDG